MCGHGTGEVPVPGEGPTATMCGRRCRRRARAALLDMCAGVQGQHCSLLIALEMHVAMTYVEVLPHQVSGGPRSEVLGGALRCFRIIGRISLGYSGQ